MPSQLEILISAKDNASAALKNVDNALKSIDGDADKASKSFSKIGNEIDAVGRKAEKTDVMGKMFGREGGGREQINRAFTGAFMAFDAVMSSMGSKLDENTKKMMDMAKAAQNIALSFAFGGLLGGATAALGVAIGAIISKIQEAEAAAQAARDAIVKPFAEAAAELSKIGDKFKPSPLADLAQSLGLGNAELLKFAESSKSAYDSLQRLASGAAGIAELNRQLQAAQAAMADASRRAQEAFKAGDMEEQARILATDYASAKTQVDFLTGAITRATAEQNALTDAARAGANAFAAQARAQTDMPRQLQPAFQSGTITPPSYQEIIPTVEGLNNRYAEMDKLLGRRIPMSIEISKDQYNKWQETLKDTSAIDAAKKALAQLEGMIKKAISPTEVTDKDIADTKAGKYKNKWDEKRRRWEAMGNKDYKPGQFANEEKDLKELGMSAEEAAAAFKDFSLFADPKNLKFADMGLIVEDVKRQLRSMAGEANLTEAALKEVWKSLTPQEKATLAKRGIGNVDDALTALLDPAQKAANDVAGLNAQIAAVPALVTTTFDVQKSTTFDTVLKQIIDDINSIPSDATITVKWNYSNREVTPPPPGKPIQNEQYGGFGISQGTQLFRTDPGEAYWFSGRNWNQPFPLDWFSQFSPASWAETNLKPKHSSAPNITIYATISTEALLEQLMRRIRAYGAHMAA